MTESDFQNWVLVGVDGSKPALAAVRWAAHEARRREVGLRVVAVSLWAEGSPEELRADQSGEHGDLSPTLAQLERAVGVARETEPDLVVEPAMLRGFACDRLKLESSAVALVVLGDRGIGGLAGAWLGSVAGAVAAGARCPVVIVRASESARDNDDAPVLVGVDDPASSDAALAFAFATAESRGAPLIAVHAYDRMLDVAPFPMLNLKGLQAQEEQLLAEQLATWSERYPTVSVERLVERERAATLLIRQAKQAQLLVVGTHGRGSLVGDLLGSVSQAVLHRAECPVAVVSPASRAATR